MQKNSFLLHWNSCKQSSESSMHCCFWLIASKHSIHLEHSFLIDKCSCKNGEYTAFWYLQLLCYLTQLQFMSGQNVFVEFFWCFLGQLLNLGNLSIQHLLCLNNHIPPLNCCFWRSRVRITLIKPLVCLNSISPPPSKSNALPTLINMKLFFHCIENLQQ